MCYYMRDESCKAETHRDKDEDGGGESNLQGMGAQGASKQLVQISTGHYCQHIDEPKNQLHPKPIPVRQLRA